jgi:sulfite exporter TauE/SafE
MSPRTIFLARLIGLFAILLSLSEFLHKQATVETAAALVRDRPLLFILGMLGLLAGLAMVLAHNVWSGGALPIVVTLFGWILLIRGTILLLLPPDTLASLMDSIHFERLFYFSAGITLVLGLYLTYAGFKASPPSR